ncbi:hypothetical protein EMCG_08146 [[Emmonsia] crescens]|uniref:Uncharacterized protein n=1 Tax=[Emmonsia] crescens TaxID=73230 RepID=A0A0G2JAP3_9EURO|nr:hypothetical protein EMCG_08146 [Emmonsia crescens UAMH 3008]
MTIATDETEALNVNQKSSALPESSCIERSTKSKSQKIRDFVGGDSQDEPRNQYNNPKKVAIDFGEKLVASRAEDARVSESWFK